MSKRVELKNKKFGYLKVIKRVNYPKFKKITAYLCKCKCNKIRIIRANSLSAGKTKSCGCLQKQKTRDRFFTHGLSTTRFYNIWKAIRPRCNNRKNTEFKNYGGRGIKCLWKNFEEFKEDMFISYNKHCKKFGEKATSIDRIDNNGNYYKSNCRWATPKIQSNNTRRNKH